MRIRSALASPPRKIFVGVDGSGRNFGHSVDAIITRFPLKKKRNKNNPQIK